MSTMISPEVAADAAEPPKVVALDAVSKEAMAPAAVSPEVAAYAAEPPEAAAPLNSRPVLSWSKGLPLNSLLALLQPKMLFMSRLSV